MYWQENKEHLHSWTICNRNDEEELLKTMGGMYASMLFIGINNASSVQPFVDVKRKVFYREKEARLYSPIVYALAQLRNPMSY